MERLLDGQIHGWEGLKTVEKLARPQSALEMQVEDSAFSLADARSSVSRTACVVAVCLVAGLAV